MELRRSDGVLLIGILVISSVFGNEFRLYAGEPFLILIAGDVAESIVFTGAVVLAIIIIVHRIGRANWFSKWIIRASNLEDPKSGLESRIQTQYPYFLGALSVLVIGLLVGIDWNVTNLADQSYGLWLDGVGAYLLAKPVLREVHIPGRVKESTDGSSELRSTVEGFWGILFLVVGFTIQLVAVLPWKRLLSMM